MFDDVEDKIRRNLLVYSWVVLVALWIDRPVWNLLGIFDQYLAAVPPHKFIFVAIVIQIYLLLRYRFSSQALRAWRRYLVEAGGVFRRLIATDVQQRVSRFKSNRTNELFDPRLQTYIIDEETYEPLAQGSRLQMHEMDVAALKFDSTWSGSFSCSTHLKNKSGAYSARSGGNRINFTYTGYRKIILIIKAIPALVLYTKGAVEMIFPVVLGLASLGVLLFQLCFM